MTLAEAVLKRLKHVNDWRGPGELAKSVTDNCHMCVEDPPTIKTVREALEEMTGKGLVAPDGNGKWRATTQHEIDAIKVGEDNAEDWARRKRIVLGLAHLLEGTPAGEDLLKVAEGL